MKDKGTRYDPVFFGMFFLGMFSVIAQVTFAREMLVVFSGNELVIGTILAGWLLGISVGAVASNAVSKIPFKRVLLVGLAVIIAVLFPLQVYFVRIARALFEVPVGEYAPFSVIMTVSIFFFMPTCIGIGLLFPLACAVAEGKETVSTAYTFEAFGSMLGGVILSFV
ncbi:hypothetical protein BVX97_00090, partial [bacterium E08(2017)]